MLKAVQLSGRLTRAPFSDLSVLTRPDGGFDVTANVNRPPRLAGIARSGLALDASGSMRAEYAPQAHLRGGNMITPVAQRMCAHLATRVSPESGTDVVYWALGPNGDQVTPEGHFTAATAATRQFPGVDPLGGGTHLLPVVRHLVETAGPTTAVWGVYVVVTDGQWSDHRQVMQYSKELAAAIHAGDRTPVRLVLIAVGSGVDASQLKALEGLDADYKLWSTRFAKDMPTAGAVFADAVGAVTPVGDAGRVLGPDSRVICEWPSGDDLYVPGTFSFSVPAGPPYFALELDGRLHYQPLTTADAGPKSPPEGLPIEPEDDLPFADEEEAAAHCGAV